MSLAIQLLVMWKLVLPLVLVFFLMVLLIYKLRANQKRPEFYHLPHLTSQQIKRLHSANLVYNTDTNGGIWIRGKHLPKTLKVLKAEHQATTRLANGSHLAILSFKSAEEEKVLKRITLKGIFPVRQERIAKLVSSILTPVTGERELVIWGNQCDPLAEINSQDGKFHLILTCDKQLPERKDWHLLEPTTILAIPTTVKLKARATNPDALPFVDFSTGLCLCELQGNKLFLLFDALGSQTPKDGRLKKLMRRLAFSGNDPYLGLLVRTLAHFAQEVLWEQEVQDYLGKAGLQNASVEALLEQKGLAPSSKALDLKISGFSGNNRQVRRQAVIGKLSQQILGDLCEKRLTIINFGGKANPPGQAEDLVIKFHSAPRIDRTVVGPSKFWNLPCLSGNADLPTPSPYGIPILDSAYHAVGEIVGREIYVYPELMVNGTGEECLLWATFLIHARQLLLAAKDAGGDAPLLEDLFAGACLRRVEYLQGKATKSLDTAREHEALSNRLAKALQDQRLMFETELNPNLDLGEEFDSLTAIPKVTDIKVEQDKLIIHTTDIFCRDPRTSKLHYIGPFKIVIPSQGNGEGIRWYNQVNFKRYNDHQAPHVSKEGKACLGNMADVFSNLIGKRHYAAAVEAAIAFVEAVNTDDTWGKHINEYPLAQTQPATN